MVWGEWRKVFAFGYLAVLLESTARTKEAVFMAEQFHQL